MEIRYKPFNISKTMMEVEMIYKGVPRHFADVVGVFYGVTIILQFDKGLEAEFDYQSVNFMSVKSQDEFDD